MTKQEVDNAKKQPVDLFIINKIKYRWIDEEIEYECFEGEMRIISP